MLRNLLGVAGEGCNEDFTNSSYKNNNSTDLTLPKKSNKTLFPLVDDDAGLLLSSEAHEGIELQVDEDELAEHLLVQFPSYGTRSQALTNSSVQWQEKTADWLLGGTSNIPTPKQQEIQRQQQQVSNVLPTTAEENPVTDGALQRSNNKSNCDGDDNIQQQKLINSRDWSVDEQLLWKSHKFPSARNRSNCENCYDSSKNNLNWQPRNGRFAINNGSFDNNINNSNISVLKLKEHEVAFQKPVLEDPSRDFIAAYYYHVGVMPKLNNRLERKTIYLDNKIETNSDEDNLNNDKTQQQELVKHHSPFVNYVSKDVSSFGGRALSNILEETEDEEEDVMSQQYLSVSSDPNSTSNNSSGARRKSGNGGSKSSAVSIAEVAWMPDQLCKTCYSCDTPFTVFRRRHHCRICGQVFCNTCSGYFVPASSSSSRQKLSLSPSSPQRNNQHQYQIGATSSPGRTSVPQSSSSVNGNYNNGSSNSIILRTCKMCFDQVTAQQQKQKKFNAAEEAAAVEDRKRRDTKEQAQQGTSSGGTETIVSTSQKHIPSNYVNMKTIDTSQLQGLHGDDEESSVLRQWSNIVEAEGNIPNSNRRLRAEQTVIETEVIESAATDVLSPLLLSKRQTSQSSSSSSSLINLDRSSIVQEGDHHLGLTAASHLELMTASLLETDAPILWKKLCEEKAADKDEKRRNEDVKNFHSKWVNKLMSLVTRCCATVDPNIKRGDMLDIRPYVKIKVIPGGLCSECAYISGIVFRKTGTNKQMPREIYNPRIMLLSGGIEFTRTARIASLDTLLEQEDKYIEILVGKILKLEPDVLMVGKGVSRRAQDLLLKNNVQLLQRVKASLLNRISRQTGATIISSTDHIMNQFGAHVLGKCHRFRFIVARDNESWVNGDSKITKSGMQHIQALLKNKKLSNHERQAVLAANILGEDIIDGSEAIQSGLSKRGVTQTYVMLEGCPKHLGCTVVLRGANKAALKQIKSVFRFLVSAAYNMKLEISYLKERCARLRLDYKVEKKNLFSTSLCVDYGSPPHNRKIRPWNGGTNNEGIQRSISGQITAFDHQSILITSVWMTDKTQCCPAEVKGICYYSMQDVSLGQFLRDSCFNLSLSCQNPSCKKSVLDHSLSFVHNDGLINITVDYLDEPLPSAPVEANRNNLDSTKQADDDSEELDDSPIATWTYCKECAKVVTPLAWLSENTWKYSFGKFLESFFYNRDTIINSPQSTCSCRLQKSATLFFGCGRLAARFTYERIRPFGVFVRKSLPIDTTFHRAKALRQLETISMASSSLFVKFDKHIEKVAREARSLKRITDNSHLQTVMSELNRISNEVDHAAKTLQEKIASVSDKCLNENGGAVNDEALFRFPWHARRFLFMLTSAWNEKLSAAGQAIVAMKKLSSTFQRNESVMGPNVPAIVAGDQNTEELNEGMRRLRQLHEVYSRYNLTDIHTVLPTIPGNTDQKIETEFDDDFEDPDGAIDFAAEVDADVLASRRRLYSTNPVPQTIDTSRLGGRPLSRRGEQEKEKTTSSQIKQTPGATVKSAITRFFQRGGRERDPYVVDLGIFHEGRPRLELGQNGIVVPVIDEQLSTVIAYSLSSKEYDNQFQNYSNIDVSNPETTNGLGSSLDGPNKLQADGTRNPLKDPQRSSSGSHPPSNPSGKQGIERRMLMRNKSHIKHTFRELDEKGQNLCKFVCTTYWATQFHAVREAFLSPGSGSKDSSCDSSFGSPLALDIERSYILSLSSAYSWAASGGKSGASFARTLDDRFVIKCISRTELQMFLDCAPAYFEYLSKAFFHGLPTVLCKIVGVYQIGYHNRVTGKRSMEQVAVMQNIFYNKKITKTFDLKGSLRGRFAAQIKSNYEDQSSHQNTINSHISDTVNGQRKHSSESGDMDGSGGTEDNPNSNDREDGATGGGADKKGPRTLLDGDFLEETFGRPMPMHDRAKAVFHMSILNDTLFLSIINVLDYSILVGIDEEKMELVVGIIDFMRQYDILKQMERVGKSLPMVVGSEAPTIIQPPLYKARFTNAMERYFMTVPSKWTTI